MMVTYRSWAGAKPPAAVQISQPCLPHWLLPPSLPGRAEAVDIGVPMVLSVRGLDEWRDEWGEM